MLTQNGMCEQVEHVKSPQEMEDDVAMKTQTKYRCFKWSKHSQKHKLWVCLQYGDREMYYSYRNVLLSFVPVVHISHLEVFYFHF